MSQKLPATPDELEARLEIIEGLIAQGLQKRHIVHWARENTDWNVTDRQVRNYVDEVMKRMSEGAAKLDRRYYHVRSLGRLDYVYRTSIEAGDRKNALTAEQAIINLLRLNDPAHEMTWKQAAEKAGINPDNFLQFMLQQHSDLAADATTAD